MQVPNGEEWVSPVDMPHPSQTLCKPHSIRFVNNFNLKILTSYMLCWSKYTWCISNILTSIMSTYLFPYLSIVTLTPDHQYKGSSFRWLSGLYLPPLDRSTVIYVMTYEKYWQFPIFIEFRSVVAEKKSKMSKPLRGQGGHLGFLIGPKNTNLVEDVKIFLPVLRFFLKISFSGCEKEVKNV